MKYNRKNRKLKYIREKNRQRKKIKGFSFNDEYDIISLPILISDKGEIFTRASRAIN